MAYVIQLRGDTAANWTRVDPVLHQRELGFETDTDKAKVGDGETAWTSLPYWSAGGSGADKNYTQPFSVTATVDVAHGLGKYPAVTVLDSAGDQVEGDVVFTDFNNLIISFSAPFSGTITCN
jgi:hypothetical protein